MGQVIHYLKRGWQDKSDIFTVLKFQSSRLWRGMPPQFEGTLQEVEGRPKKRAQMHDAAFPAAAKTAPQKPAAATKAAGSATPAPDESPAIQPEQDKAGATTETGKRKSADRIPAQHAAPETIPPPVAVPEQAMIQSAPETGSQGDSHLEQDDENTPAGTDEAVASVAGADDLPFAATELDDPFAPGAGEADYPPLVNNAGISHQYTDTPSGHDVPADDEAVPDNSADDDDEAFEVIDDVPVEHTNGAASDDSEAETDENIPVIDDVPAVREPEKNSVRFNGESSAPVSVTPNDSAAEAESAPKP